MSAVPLVGWITVSYLEIVMDSMVRWPKTNLKTPSTDSFQEAATLLQRHVIGKRAYAFSHYQFKNGERIVDSFHGQNRRREFFQDCTFDHADLSGAGFAGGVFRSCTFRSCNMEGLNLRDCKFVDCVFEQDTDLPVEQRCAVNFARSMFWECSFQDTYWENSQFDSVLFYRTSIGNTTFCSCNFENSQFVEATLRTVRFRAMNLEFSHFKSLLCEDVLLPFPSVPFIFGGIAYLRATQDTVRVTSATKKDRQGISAQEYISLLPQLETYYGYSKAFFPLTNIYLAEGRYQDAADAACEGVKLSIAMRDYRMTRFLCMQISNNALLSSSKAMELYTSILCSAREDRLSPSDRYQFEFYRPSIEHSLLSAGEASLDIIISTPIEEVSDPRFSLLVDIIEECISLAGKDVRGSITMRRCSPIELFIAVSAYAGAIYTALMCILKVIKGANEAYQMTIESISKTVDLYHKLDDPKERKSQDERCRKLNKQIREAMLDKVELHFNILNSDTCETDFKNTSDSATRSDCLNSLNNGRE